MCQLYNAFCFGPRLTSLSLQTQSSYLLSTGLPDLYLGRIASAVFINSMIIIMHCETFCIIAMSFDMD